MFSVILDRVLHLLYKDHSHSAQIHYAFPVAVVLWGKTMTVQLQQLFVKSRGRSVLSESTMTGNTCLMWAGINLPAHYLFKALY